MPVEPLDVPAGVEPLRIESPVAGEQAPTVKLRRAVSKARRRAAAPEEPAAKSRIRGGRRPVVASEASTPVDQAIALRDSLLLVARHANHLARTLKLQRRQERLVASTLASLKALQKAAG